MPDLSLLIELATILDTSGYELLLGEEITNRQTDNIEAEIRFLYSLSEKEKIINYFKLFNELTYMGAFNEKTLQYIHPMKEYNFFLKK